MPLSKKNTSLLARPSLLPILKVGGDPLGADAHLSRPHPPLSSGPPFIWLEASRAGVSGVSPVYF